MEMKYSCILNHKNEKIVKVRFEEKDTFAEGSVPDCKISRQKGFSLEEIKQLEQYLARNKTEILKEAKKITGIMHWFQNDSKNSK